MQSNYAAKAYQKTSVNTADTLSLVLMCYDATVRDLEQAKDHHSRREMEAAYQKIRHAQDVVTELLVGLDYERGGAIATNLGRVYNFAIRQMIGINSVSDVSIYDQLISLMNELREAWEEIRQSDSTNVRDPYQSAAPAPAAMTEGLNLST
jgi:flagellar protein FliS